MPVTLSLTVNGKAARAERRSAHAARRIPAQRPRPHRHARRLRHRRSAAPAPCTSTAARSRRARSSPRRRRARRHDDRRPRRRRRHAASDAGGVQGMPRPAVRLLHAGHGDERDRPRASGIPNASEETIREELEGNLCRCTGYQNIVKAVQQGAAAMAQVRRTIMGANDQRRDRPVGPPQGGLRASSRAPASTPTTSIRRTRRTPTSCARRTRTRRSARSTREGEGGARRGRRLHRRRSRQASTACRAAG